MNLLPSPLSRTFATAPGCPRQQKDAGAEGESFIRQVLMAYSHLPFKGDPLVVPKNVVVCDDLWLAALKDDLEFLADDGLANLQEFNLETWLVDKVQDEGSETQQEELRLLRQRLDDAEAEEAAVAYGGLPNDICAVMQEPVSEIPVYRSLDITDDHDDDDDDKDQAADAGDDAKPDDPN